MYTYIHVYIVHHPPLRPLFFVSLINFSGIGVVWSLANLASRCHAMPGKTDYERESGRVSWRDAFKSIAYIKSVRHSYTVAKRISPPLLPLIETCTRGIINERCVSYPRLTQISRDIFGFTFLSFSPLQHKRFFSYYRLGQPCAEGRLVCCD